VRAGVLRLLILLTTHTPDSDIEKGTKRKEGNLFFIINRQYSDAAVLS
jgi:hypothetical protein